MQYKCDFCHDSGSKNQTGDYLDCPACDMPMIRKALNDFVKSLGPTHPEDVALAIHQRALAMAPKQEAPEIHCQEFHELAMDYRGASPLGAIAAYDALCKYVNQRIAAPAAANGAPDGYVMVPLKPTPAMLKAMAESRATDDEGDFPLMTDLLDFSGENKARTALEAAYVAAVGLWPTLAAAGPDAALIDEREAFEAKYGPKESFAWRNADDTYKVASLQMAWEIWQARAALSGAKGN